MLMPKKEKTKKFISHRGILPQKGAKGHKKFKRKTCRSVVNSVIFVPSCGYL
jgi:hypothetical protein